MRDAQNECAGAKGVVVLKRSSWGLPRCKNLTRFSLFVSFCFAVRYCLKCFCFLCFTSSVSFTGSYTEVKPRVVGGKPIYLFIQLLFYLLSSLF